MSCQESLLELLEPVADIIVGAWYSQEGLVSTRIQNVSMSQRKHAIIENEL